MVSPAVFVPILEAAGLIEVVGEWVLRTACRQHRSWRQAGLVPPRIAVNVSGRQFLRGGFAETLPVAEIAALLPAPEVHPMPS